MKRLFILATSLLVVSVSLFAKTVVSIKGDKICINGTETFKGKTWRGYSIEGLLPNSRMANAVFDDETDSTRYKWVYPDTKKWDAERNTNEFIEQLPIYRKKGLLAIGVNLQGGSPQGYSKGQPWCNTAITPDGGLKPAYMDRMGKIIEKADELGMVVIMGIYYFGQEKYINDEAAVKKGIKNTVEWVLKNNYTNVLLEINNECDFYHKHSILKPARVHEAILYAKSIQVNGKRLLVSTSNGGGKCPTSEMVKAADFILLHGNGLNDPKRIVNIVEKVRSIDTYTSKPIIFNEDDHYDFEKPINNFVAATSVGVSWGFFDYRRSGEDFNEGFQCVPVDWRINSDRKKGFFNIIDEWE